MSRQQVIEDLKEKIRRRTPKSGALSDKAKEVLPNGEISSVRGFDPWPFYAESADGVRVRDIDGNEYLDFCMCFGVLLLGHRPALNVRAIQNHLEASPLHYGMPTPAELEFAEKFVKCVPCAEQVMLCNTGNEAVHKAVALARAYTGKNKVAKFEGCFHGSNEYSNWSFAINKELMGPVERPNLVPMQAGMARAAEEAMVLLPFGHEEAFRIIEENADDLAVVMLEPATGPACLHFEPAYLRKLKEVTKRCGVLLLFDEIINGFRLALGGGQELFGVTPDIGLFGKCMGGGSPVGAVATRKEVFEKVLHLDPPIMLTGTFSGNAVTLNNSIAMMDHLMENNPAVYQDLAAKGDGLRTRFNDFAREKGIPANMSGVGSMWQVHMTEKPVKKPRDRVNIDKMAEEEFNLRIRLEGIFVPEHSHIAFISTAHTDADIDELLRVLKVSLEGCFQGR
ncbi:MAG: aminotransferase class III-fold pyridoxal phosphate-dependent enzyme [Deltaproteobacteria bacterium]|nr:aminotransferase class III-fold pyridoxal phosphate-dependent enzyme [Deltaproteobacteria bacterium]